MQIHDAGLGRMGEGSGRGCFGKTVSEPCLLPSSSFPAAPAAAGGPVLRWLQGACSPSLHTAQRPRRGRGEYPWLEGRGGRVKNRRVRPEAARDC